MKVLSVIDSVDFFGKERANIQVARILKDNGHRVRILNNINDNPKEYSLYVEVTTIQKEQYLTGLEQLFAEDLGADQKGNRRAAVQDGS